MIREISRFKQDVISYLEALDNNPDIDHNETLGHFIQSHGYSELFQKAYLVKEELEKRGCQIRTGSEVNSVSTNEEERALSGCTISCNDGVKEVYDGCIIAAHAPDTLKMLGKEATYDETRILGAFQYVYRLWLHEDGLKAGVAAADGMLRRNGSILYNPKQMLVGRRRYTFHLPRNRGNALSKFRLGFIVATQFYWKRFCDISYRVATQAELGLADASLFMGILLIRMKSNELFSPFMDETMAYSCAIFKSEDEDLKDAQLRKISLLIRKVSHQPKAVKQTGCKYTGIPSEQQLEYAQLRVEQAGLQDCSMVSFYPSTSVHIALPVTCRASVISVLIIIFSEVLEHVGHEFIGEFFTCCEAALAEDGLLVLQYCDVMYDEYRHSASFIKEYIFPGGCLPALSRVTSAMAAASRLCVVHLEEIGIHYYQTLRCWKCKLPETSSNKNQNKPQPSMLA
ncbi:cfs1-like protein [Datura stramonium]|uniref:Cfs1-like protein n=1 Tax=Datura stramonium TaxID=4076 RepID=A0ABS8WLX2_DATST|nr:cfs1-like protein [Datura stramonium]